MYYLIYYGSLIIIVPGLIFAIIAQISIKLSYAKYSKIQSKIGMSASEVSRNLLKNYGCNGVVVTRISGNLTDNYNPSNDVLSLSDTVYDSQSIGAIGVAAHECGHACQQHENSLMLNLRKILVPITNFGSRLAVPVVVVGLILELLLGASQTNNLGSLIIAIGCLMYSLSTIFALVTLPVEFNASHRALRMLKEQNVLEKEELRGARSVLTAAAMTYVASLVVSLLYLLRFLLIVASVRGRNKRD